MTTSTVAVDTASRNGTEQVAFPLESFKEAAVYLRRPFTASAVRFKVQATFKGEGDTLSGGLIVSYIDARLVVERLNLLVPHLWSEEYEEIDATHLRCLLTVDGITRRDIGEGSGKGLYSDALKRAAVKFGIGVSVYAVPKMILNKGGDLKEVGRTGKKTLILTDAGERNVRAKYAEWLESKGTAAFGDPLDHGDVGESQGDYEAEAAAEPEPSAPSAERLLTAPERRKVLKAIEDAGKDVELMLGAMGVEATDDLTTAHAFEIRAELDKS